MASMKKAMNIEGAAGTVLSTVWFNDAVKVEPADQK
jgi:hypothetical protein